VADHEIHGKSYFLK